MGAGFVLTMIGRVRLTVQEIIFDFGGSGDIAKTVEPKTRQGLKEGDFATELVQFVILNGAANFNFIEEIFDELSLDVVLGGVKVKHS